MPVKNWIRVADLDLKVFGDRIVTERDNQSIMINQPQMNAARK